MEEEPLQKHTSNNGYIPWVSLLCFMRARLTISGFKSTKKSSETDTIGAFCILLSLIAFLIAFTTESGIWAWSLTIIGVGLLIVEVGTVLISERRTAKK